MFLTYINANERNQVQPVCKVKLSILPFSLIRIFTDSLSEFGNDCVSRRWNAGYKERTKWICANYRYRAEREDRTIAADILQLTRTTCRAGLPPYFAHRHCQQHHDVALDAWRCVLHSQNTGHHPSLSSCQTPTHTLSNTVSSSSF